MGWSAVCFVRWSMAESCAVFGFVIGFVGGPMLLALALFALALLVIAVQAPTDRAEELWREASRAR